MVASGNHQLPAKLLLPSPHFSPAFPSTAVRRSFASGLWGHVGRGQIFYKGWKNDFFEKGKAYVLT